MNSTQINVIQFGTGNFLRAFIEPVFQNLKDKGIADPKICLIESTGSGKVKELSQTYFNYPLWITGLQNGQSINQESKIDCIESGLALPQDQEGFLKLAENESLEWIISNVTEAGFVLPHEESKKNFPNSFPARLALFLYRRYEFFEGDTTKGLHILPCELLAENGKKLNQMVLDQAKKWNLSPDFEFWIFRSCHFYTSLVDRIVPGKPSSETLAKYFQEATDHNHRVQAEPYFLLALQGEPKLEPKMDIVLADYPVLQVENLKPYAVRKVRILNGAHIAMVILGIPKGVETVSAFMENQDLFLELKSMIENEVIPYIDQDKPELMTYTNEIWDRFRNPFVKHKLRDISLNTIAKLSPRIIDSIASYYDSKGVLPPILSKVLVGGITNYFKSTEQIKDTESVKDVFVEAKKIKDPDGKADFLLSHQDLWNRDLRSFDGLDKLLAASLD